MRLNFSVPVAALLVGTGLGYCLSPAAKPVAETEADGSAKAEETLIPDARGEAGVAALRARVKELEALLAVKAAEAQPTAERVAEGGRRRERPRNPREFMEQLKKDDPARYAQMTNGMERFRRRRQERAQSKMDFFSSIDTSGMGRETQETHARLVALIAQREDIEARMHDENLTDEERDAVMDEMFAAERELRDLNRQERRNLLNETVRELGYTGEDAEEIATTLADIIRATDSDFGGPPHGGPGGPGGRGGAPRHR